MSEVIHFAHGNGFPSPCYRQLFEHLQLRYACCYIDRIGHSADFPVTDNWHCLVNEIIQSIESQSSQPVIAVGHSLGGVLSFLAAIEKPALFKSVILLDSPIIGRFKSNVIRLSKALGMIDHVTPAHRTRGRRHHWATREQAWRYLKSKNLFKSFTDACLDDYIDFGMNKTDKGYELRFDRDIEYKIYRTIPHILHEYEGQLRVPTALIYGNKSDVITPAEVSYMKINYDIACHETKGSHMFPMEYPKAVADLIMSVQDTVVDK